MLLRLTHASLSAALAAKPKVWRDVRTAVMWREPFQLIRLPILRALVGSDSDVSEPCLIPHSTLLCLLTPCALQMALLSPLCDLFSCVVLANAARQPVLQPHAMDTVDDADHLRLPCAFTNQMLSSGALKALVLVASGSTVLESPPQPPQPLTAGEWLNGSLLLAAEAHAAEPQV